MDAPDHNYRRADMSALPLTVVLMTKPRPDKGFVEAVAMPGYQAVHRRRASAAMAAQKSNARRRADGAASAAMAALGPEQEEGRRGQRGQREADGAEPSRVVCDKGKQGVDGRSPERAIAHNGVA
jgi:hypothetical protein